MWGNQADKITNRKTFEVLGLRSKLVLKRNESYHFYCLIPLVRN